MEDQTPIKPHRETTNKTERAIETVKDKTSYSDNIGKLIGINIFSLTFVRYR
jgi:hypothetical protein